MVKYAGSAWQDEHVEALAEALAGGMSCSQAAAALNTRFGTSYTRNAIIGMAVRRDMKRNTPNHRSRRRAQLEKGVSPKAPRAPAKKSAKKQGSAWRGDGVSKPPSPAPLREIEVPLSQRVTFDELLSRHCRYPMGDPRSEDFTFCGGARHNGKSAYCRDHHALCYAPTPGAVRF